MVWTNLNEDNKVSLFVRFIDIETGEYETRIVNKQIVFSNYMELQNKNINFNTRIGI
ncbi:MAG: hypothetical protein ACLRPW_08670 [Intestinibacter sp.]